MKGGRARAACPVDEHRHQQVLRQLLLRQASPWLQSSNASASPSYAERLTNGFGIQLLHDAASSSADVPAGLVPKFISGEPGMRPRDTIVSRDTWCRLAYYVPRDSDCSPFDYTIGLSNRTKYGKCQTTVNEQERVACDACVSTWVCLLLDGLLPTLRIYHQFALLFV